MDSDAQFDQIAGDLAARGVLPGAMFGSRSLTLEGTAFACLKGGRFAVKLGVGSQAHADAMALDGAELFDPSGKGRPFKDWVAVPAALADDWDRLAEAALSVLTGGEA